MTNYWCACFFRLRCVVPACVHFILAHRQMFFFLCFFCVCSREMFSLCLVPSRRWMTMTIVRRLKAIVSLRTVCVGWRGWLLCTSTPRSLRQWHLCRKQPPSRRTRGCSYVRRLHMSIHSAICLLACLRACHRYMPLSTHASHVALGARRRRR